MKIKQLIMFVVVLLFSGSADFVLGSEKGSGFQKYISERVLDFGYEKVTIRVASKEYIKQIENETQTKIDQYCQALENSLKRATEKGACNDSFIERSLFDLRTKLIELIMGRVLGLGGQDECVEMHLEFSIPKIFIFPLDERLANRTLLCDQSVIFNELDCSQKYPTLHKIMKEKYEDFADSEELSDAAEDHYWDDDDPSDDDNLG